MRNENSERKNIYVLLNKMEIGSHISNFRYLDTTIVQQYLDI